MTGNTRNCRACWYRSPREWLSRVHGLSGFLSLLGLLAGVSASAGGVLTDNIRIGSAALGYDLHYRIYLPEDLEPDRDYPVLFLTDGQDYLRHGRVIHTLDRLIQRERIVPLIAVFVDSRDPDHARVNRRNEEFFCNRSYLDFYTQELIPALEREYPLVRNRDGRTILGFSFGGLNAACFGLLGYTSFSGIAMQSPAVHPLPRLVPVYRHSSRLPLRFFISTGKPDDNTSDSRYFRAVLEEKGYPLEYLEIRAGHDWKNWRSTLDNVLLYFFRKQTVEEGDARMQEGKERRSGP